MGPEAEVDPVAVAVEGERLGPLGGDVLDDLDLVLLALPLEERERLLHRDLLADEGVVGGDGLVGGLLDLLEVLGREGRLAGEVVVEAVLDGRADGDLGARVELLHHAGHDVGGVVARHLERLGVPGGDHLEPDVAVERAGEVHRLAVELGDVGGLGQARRRSAR